MMIKSSHRYLATESNLALIFLGGDLEDENGKQSSAPVEQQRNNDIHGDTSYDAAGPEGWLCALAVSKDIVTWEKKGPVLDFGKPGEDDSKSASYGVTYPDGEEWHMFYLGTPNVSSPPNRVPSFPYLTLNATTPCNHSSP